MTSTWLAAVLAVGAAGSFALSSAAKHLSAERAPDPLARGLVGAMTAFVLYTLRHPLWLLGVGADLVGLVLQVIALHLGGLILVQPILVSAVAGTLVLRRVLGGRRVHRHELALALVLAAGLIAFELSLRPQHHAASAPDRSPAYLLGIVGLVLVLSAIGIAVVRRGGRMATALLGAAGGLLYAAGAALITLVGAQVVHDGWLAPLRRDELYVLVAVAVVAQVLNQTAFQAGALAVSAPSSASADLIASVILAIVVFDQPLPTGTFRTTGVALGAAAVLITVVALARIEPFDENAPLH